MLAAIAAFALTVTGTSVATVCIVPDNGGTASLPPTCPNGYLSPAQVHLIINGLPPGNTLLLDASHTDFFDIQNMPGGSLGGEKENFQSVMLLQIIGQGPMLGGYNRFIIIHGACETHIAPRTPGQPTQSFNTTMFALQGQIVGDPDFDLLRITAGDAFGMPSPGHTTLTQVPGGWNVDSFFEINYRIDFTGEPGSIISGMSGSTTGTIRMQAGEPACACQLYGDVVQNCSVDLDDILRVLLGFSNSAAHPEADIAPCGGNGTVDLDDILRVISTFAGIYACPHPCPP